jgi:membrane fusion protein, copper/silver efflux system
MKNNIFSKCFCIILSGMLLLSCNNRPKESLAENEYYVCSMDPQVLEKQAGMCPICKMPLAKTVIDKNELNIIKLNAEQMKLANVKVDTVKISSVGKETILTGVFAVNENKTEQISSRINGRIEKLYRKVIGEELKASEPLYDLYSRQLMLAQDEYLIAVDKSKLLGGSSVIVAAKNKLLLWGLLPRQISELEKTKRSKITNTIYSKVSGTITEISINEGDNVNEGTKIFKLADLNTLWVEARLYSNELGLIEEGKKVEIIPEGMPEEITEGAITFSNPQLQAETKINLVRIEVDNARKKFRPGMQAYVIHHSEQREAVVLPVDAVIRDGKNSLVWIQNEKGGFESRMVETGIENKNKIEIISGLKEGELVAVSGAYLINSEYVFKRGMMPMENMKGMEMPARPPDGDAMNGMQSDTSHSNHKM